MSDRQAFPDRDAPGPRAPGSSASPPAGARVEETGNGDGAARAPAPRRHPGTAPPPDAPPDAQLDRDRGPDTGPGTDPDADPDPDPDADGGTEDDDAPRAGASGARARRKARRQRRNLARALSPPDPAQGGDDIGTAAEPVPEDDRQARARRVRAIERDLVHRRRRRAAGLLLRLLVLVLLPTLVTGWYFFRVATPMYAVSSEFVIQKPETGGEFAGLFSGFGMADSKDSIAVQGYLASADAMLRLDRDLGFRALFSDPAIDPLQRLAPGASLAEAMDLYQRVVEVGFDMREGVLRMQVIAPDPDQAVAFTRGLIGYAEAMVDQLSARARRESVAEAQKAYGAREVDVRAAAAAVLELQERYATFSADAELQIDLSVIQAQELQREDMLRRLALMRRNSRPNQAQVTVLEREIAILEEAIARRRAGMTGAADRGLSLAGIASALELARSELATREEMRMLALETLEQARVEAGRQVRYLSVNVPPVAPDTPSYPRALENTAVAFFVFLGAYIMISLTVSILREQVSA